MKTESTQVLEERRNLMINAMQNSNDAIDEVVYALALAGIDRELNRRIWKRNVAIGLVIMACTLTAIFVFSCNTVNGIGKDLQSVSKPYIVDKGE